MNRADQYKSLALKFKVQRHANELNKALTHSSYFASENENNNSRYVFLGMFAFRGYVAEQLFRFSPGTGTQLQHVLGNLFKNELLHQIYDTFGLDALIRYGEDFDYKKHKHIFVYGFLGFIHQHCTDEVKNHFISKHFIFPNQQLFKKKTRNNDFVSQCNVIARVIYQKPISVTISEETPGLFTAAVAINDYVLATSQSKSFRYVRHKTLKLALKRLVDASNALEEMKPGYVEKQQKAATELEMKREKLRLEKLQLQKEKEARKMAEKRERHAKLKEKLRLQDERRKKIKQSLKERKAAKAQKDAENAAKLATISVQKRRHLQDKAK